MDDADVPRLRLELSGRPRLLYPDSRALPLEPHDAALLALVALDGPVSREHVFDLLWPGCNRKAAQGNLRQRLFRLRRKTGALLLLADEVLTLAPGVEHDLDADAWADSPLLGDLRFHAHERLAEWLDAARERRRRQGSERLAGEASRLEAEGRLAEAIDRAERLVEREPTLEHAHRRSMRLHYRRGDRAAALHAYQRCRESLDRLLGTGPSAETEALAALITQSLALPEPSLAPPPVNLLRPPRLIGRDAAWRAWESGWRDGRVVVVRGEPGIGKSRLLEDFSAAHGLGRTAPARPGDARMPYTTWARWLGEWRERFGPPGEPWVDAEIARLVPGLGMESSAAFTLLRFRRACFDALAGWFVNGLDHVVVDDLQYADEASLEMLLAWCSHRPRQGVAMAVRSAEIPPLLVDWLDAQRGDGQVVELALDALDRHAIGELVDSLDIAGTQAPQWADELARSTGGNPFFMIELLRAARLPDGSLGILGADRRQPLSPTSQLGRLLTQRLAQLPPEAVRLARLAGLAGADFSVELAAATLGVRPIDLIDAWAVLEDAQVFRDGAFVHDLMRESAAASVPAAIAKTLHGAIAAALDPARVARARIAHHALEAGDWAIAAVQLEAAAIDALTAARHREAVGFCDRARDCFERLGDARAALRVGCRAVDSAVHVEPEAALDARTLALLETADGEPEELAACIARTKHLGSAYRHADMIAPAERALRLAQRMQDGDAELLVVGFLSTALCLQGRHQDGLDLMRAPAGRFEAMAESMPRCEFAIAYAQLLAYVGRALEAAAWCERAIESSERLERNDDLAVQWGNLATIRWQLGRIDAAVAAGRRSLALHALHSEAGGATPLYARITLANCLKRVDGWEEAERLFEEALASARGGFPPLVPVVENHLATLYLELGQYARSRQTLATVPARPGTLLRRAIIEARLDAQSGKANAAERLTALMDEHRDGAGTQPFDQLTHRLGAALVGSADHAMGLCLAVRDEAAAIGLKSVALSAAARLASAASETGAPDDALRWARLALAESSSFAAFDMDAPELAWHVCQGLTRQAPDEAQTLARTALERVRASLARIAPPYRDAYWNRSRFVPRLRALVARGPSGVSTG